MAPHLPATILVIDDEPSVVRALTRLLRRDGYRVGTASNGRHALTRLQERHYDVIVCGLHMPDLDGPAFYAILARQYPAIRQRVIFLTGDTGGGGQSDVPHAVWPPVAAQALSNRDDPAGHSARAPGLPARRGLARAGAGRVACLSCPQRVLPCRILPSPGAPSGAGGVACPARLS